MIRVTPPGTVPIVIVGLHSSGKSTLARSLASAMKATVFELGAGVRRAARERDERNLVQVAHDLLAEDPIYLAAAAIRRSDTQRDPSIFVGPRTSVEFDYLTEILGNPLTVGLRATEERRRAQWRRRHLRFADTWEQRELYEKHWETAKIVENCALVIDAEESLDSKTSRVQARLQDMVLLM